MAPCSPAPPNDAASGGSQEATPVKYSDDYNFPDGDIELVSSCGVRFRVHSYKLRAASSVFNTMMDIGKGKSDGSPPVQEVVLTDTKIETAAVITLFLNFVYGKPPKLATAENVPKHWRQVNKIMIEPLVSFVGKYDATLISMVLSFAMISWLERDLFHPLEAFALGCTLPDINICKASIRRGSGWKWLADEGKDVI
ncbi:hypothetical protein IAT38_003313 [Cryptococcus sp. DSM 104549]